MKITLSALLVIAVHFSVYSQTKAPITEYFDKDWKTVVDQSKASYYRTVEEIDRGYMVRDYFISGKIQEEAECNKVTPRLVFNGKRTLYYENGNIKETGEFDDNEEKGVHKWYYENGKLKKELSYERKDTRYLHYWSEDGTDELADGEGVVEEFISEKYLSYRTIQNFLSVDAFSINRVSGDTVYMVADQAPEYPGGFSQMYLDLRNNLEYPTSARRKGITGTVYVSFEVGKDGLLRNLEVLRGIDPECDAAALHSVSKLGLWKPGMHKKKTRGAQLKPVAVRYNLPIKFSLKN